VSNDIGSCLAVARARANAEWQMKTSLADPPLAAKLFHRYNCLITHS
jgi:hypothetical protein